mmetsp:Transcript_58955/g.138645  ORF Transcript_58955/g.138645 Transcript_58955/m.138645 type:complete len:725 (+) Transcript_58955:210-2384(+)
MRTSPALTFAALVALNILSIQAHYHDHDHDEVKCVHHKLQHEKQVRSHQKYSRTSPIKLRGAHEGSYRRTDHEPIRVTFDQSQLGVNIGVNQRRYIEKVLDEAKKYIENLISVVPVEGNLFVARRCKLVWTSGPNEGLCAQEAPLSDLRCGTMNSIPADHVSDLFVVDTDGNESTVPGGTGLPRTDLLVYVTASQLDDICLQSDALAYANSCQRDQNDRPIVAYINFCSNKVDPEPDAEPEHNDIKLALHELTHILGMSQSSYPFWREMDGTPRTQRCPDNPLCGAGGTSWRTGEPPQDQQGSFLVSTDVLREIETPHGRREAIVTPAVQRAVRAHFDCPALEGAELEDAGGEGTQLSHWEKRIFFSEYMTGSTQSGSQSVVSAVTLALLQDTGWYDVNLNGGSQLEWGLHAGCGFAQDKCPDLGCSNGGQAADEDDVCAFDRSAIGYCDVDPLMDGCPVVLPYVDQECGASDQVKIRVKCEGEDCLGSYFGAGSACFESSLKLNGFEAPYTSSVSCYRHRCSTQGGRDILEVQTPDGKWQQCSDGDLLKSGGYVGRILCPPTGQLCGPFSGPALPSAKLAIPLDLDSGDAALNFITDASPMDWALYAGAAAGAFGALCLCFSVYRWRKRSTSGLAGRLGFKRNDRWAGNTGPGGVVAPTAAQLAFDAQDGEGGRRTSAELEYEEALRTAQLRADLAAHDHPQHRLPAVNGGSAQVDKSRCAVM